MVSSGTYPTFPDGVTIRTKYDPSCGPLDSLARSKADRSVSSLRPSAPTRRRPVFQSHSCGCGLAARLSADRVCNDDFQITGNRAPVRARQLLDAFPKLGVDRMVVACGFFRLTIANSLQLDAWNHMPRLPPSQRTDRGAGRPAG
jgi:hypothetical protein